MATVEQSETTVVTLTEGAAAKVSKLMAEEPVGEAEVLRIAIQGGGCSGFEYALGFDRSAQAGDHELEFLEGLQESGFKIENPNVSSACGCGHSFQVEDGEAPAADAGCGSGCGHAH